MKRIDPENWNGKVMFERFADMDMPFFSMTTQLDASGLLERSKAENRSFFSLSLFAVSRAMNSVEAMRYRLLEDGQIVLYDTIDPVYVAMRDDGTIPSCEYRSGRISTRSRLCAGRRKTGFCHCRTPLSIMAAAAMSFSCRLFPGSPLPA